MTVWNDVYRERPWGRWPDLDAVRTVARTSAALGRSLDVLEVGCGPGAQLWYLAHEGHRGFGLDISEVGLIQAKARLASEGSDVPLVVGTGPALPLADESFDLVIDIEAFGSNHQDDVPEMWREASRVLRPGGTMMTIGFTTECTGAGTAKAIASRTVSEVDEGPLQRVGIISFLTLEVVDELAAASGLTVANVTRRRRESLGDDGFVVEELVVTAHKRH